MDDSKEKALFPGSPEKYKSAFSIRFKMLLYFGLLFSAILITLKLVEFLGLPLSGFEGEIKIREAEVLKSLDLLADQKKEQIVKWLAERRSDTRVLVEGDFGERVVELQSWSQKNKDNRKDIKADTNYKEIIKQISLVKTSYGVYSDIDVIDPEKQTIIASTDDKRLASASAYPEPLSRFRSSAAVYLINFQKNENTGLLELLIFGAIKLGEKTIAIVIMHIDPEDILKPILHMGKGLGETGEALLVDKYARILTHLKHPLPDGAIPKPFEYIIETNPAKFAARRSQGITISLDYRNEPVLAAYRYISLSTATGWGLVVKRDQAEIFASLHKSMYYSIGVAIVSLILTLYMAYLIASNLSFPIKVMSATANRVAKGDLDVRMKASGFKEAILMSEMFNLMVERLQNWHKELEGEVKRRSLDLKEEERKVRLLLYSTTEGIYGVDLNGNCTFVNPSCVKILGYGHMNQLMGKNMHNLMHHTRKDGTPYPEEECRIYEAFRERRTLNIKDEFFWRANGTGFAVEYWSNPIWQDDKTIGTVVTFIDITERVQAEEEQERFIAELEIKNAELEQFAYTIFHDIKSPLITIKGFLGLLEKDALEGNIPRLKEDVKYIRVAASQIGQLLNDLLELAQIGRVVNPPEAVSLADLAGEAVRLVAGQISEKGVQVEIAPDLPIIYVDRPRFLEVMQNLVDNAVKYTEERKRPRVEIGSRQDGEETVYYVRDNGMGIDPRYHEKIFGLFNKLNPESEGTGIGLAVVKRIVEAHGGRIWVESEGLGKGSAFCFTVGKN